MKTEDIRKMALALEEVKKLTDEAECATSNPIKKNKKTSGKSMKETEIVVQEESEQLDELSKKTLGSYTKKAAVNMLSKSVEGGGKLNSNDFGRREAGYKDLRKAGRRLQGIARASDRLTKEEISRLEKITGQPAQTIMNAPEIKEPKKTSATQDTSRLDNMRAPAAVDGAKAIIHNRNAEKISMAKAESDTIKEDYNSNQLRYVEKAKIVAKEIYDMINDSYDNHMKAVAASQRINDAYAKGLPPDKTDLKLQSSKFYDCKYLVRQLEDLRDALETKNRDLDKIGYTYESLNVETRTPISINHALQMMKERADPHTAGAYPPEGMTDKWSDKAIEFAQIHALDIPEESNIDDAIRKNKEEVEASLARRVNYRHNDQQIGDKTMPKNDGQ